MSTLSFNSFLDLCHNTEGFYKLSTDEQAYIDCQLFSVLDGLDGEVNNALGAMKGLDNYEIFKVAFDLSSATLPVNSQFKENLCRELHTAVYEQEEPQVLKADMGPAGIVVTALAAGHKLAKTLGLVKTVEAAPLIPEIAMEATASELAAPAVIATGAGVLTYTGLDWEINHRLPFVEEVPSLGTWHGPVVNPKNKITLIFADDEKAQELPYLNRKLEPVIPEIGIDVEKEDTGKENTEETDWLNDPGTETDALDREEGETGAFNGHITMNGPGEGDDIPDAPPVEGTEEVAANEECPDVETVVEFSVGALGYPAEHIMYTLAPRLIETHATKDITPQQLAELIETLIPPFPVFEELLTHFEPMHQLFGDLIEGHPVSKEKVDFYRDLLMYDMSIRVGILRAGYDLESDEGRVWWALGAFHALHKSDEGVEDDFLDFFPPKTVADDLEKLFVNVKEGNFDKIDRQQLTALETLMRIEPESQEAYGILLVQLSFRRPDLLDDILALLTEFDDVASVAVIKGLHDLRRGLLVPDSSISHQIDRNQLMERIRRLLMESGFVPDAQIVQQWIFSGINELDTVSGLNEIEGYQLTTVDARTIIPNNPVFIEGDRINLDHLVERIVDMFIALRSVGWNEGEVPTIEMMRYVLSQTLRDYPLPPVVSMEENGVRLCFNGNHRLGIIFIMVKIGLLPSSVLDTVPVIQVPVYPHDIMAPSMVLGSYMSWETILASLFSSGS
ncbi:hypothetical protein K1X76_12870 [bacterium]|nr:hypothetical protein [bacterium]